MDREDKRIVFTAVAFVSIYVVFVSTIAIVLATRGDSRLLVAEGIIAAIVACMFIPWWLSGKIFK